MNKNVELRSHAEHNGLNIHSPAAEHARRAVKFVLKCTGIDLVMYQNGTSHVLIHIPKNMYCYRN